MVIIRQAVTQEQVARLRDALEDVFSRTDSASSGARTDMTSAAEAAREQGDVILEDSASGGAASGRFLTEIDCGRFHSGVRQFQHQSDLPTVLGPLLGTRTLRFFGDHCFLKEAGSQLHTAFHQDMPFFRWDGDQAAVCWVPVDSVTKECGAMRYVKGSHRWPQYAPRLLVSNSPVDDGAAEYSPLLPENDELFETEEILSWDCEPGDVIVHHPNMVHGSGGNVSKGQRRLAASMRYIGDDVRWSNKPTAAGLTHLLDKWHSTVDYKSLAARAGLGALGAAGSGELSVDDMYAIADRCAAWSCKQATRWTALKQRGSPFRLCGRRLPRPRGSECNECVSLCLNAADTSCTYHIRRPRGNIK